MTHRHQMPRQSPKTSPAASSLDNVRHVWELLAQDDPLWAILSYQEKKGNKWSTQEFFETGVSQIANLMDTLRYHEIAFDADAVLDFGCGVGRLSQALLPYFRSVSGVDVSPTMIAMAQELNRDASRCNYYLNEREDLALFQEQRFSFIYSIIVLQHLPPDLARKYIAEFVRILRPNGVLVFQLPARFVQEKEFPGNAFSAVISCDAAKLALTIGETVTLSVRVENNSPAPWNYNEPFSLHLGNHWLGPDGSMHVVDDGRTRLPTGMEPGQAISTVLQVKAPAVAGNYLLELDVVQERVAWFKDRGSRTCLIEAVVVDAATSGTEKPAPSSAPGQEVDDSAEDAGPILPKGIHFDMHCTPRSEIVELLRSLGCKLEFIEASGLGGSATLSYIYYARKSGA